MAGKQRIIAYVDGFNLYFGLRQSGLRRCYWLNLQALAESLLRPGQVLVATKYFTSRISGGRPGDGPSRIQEADRKRKRQSDYLEALATLADFQVFEGHYLAKDITCFRCGAKWRTHEEKMTDVCIATEMLVDAFDGSFDTALVLSADSDLVPPIRAIRQRFPGRRIVVCFPPGRDSVQLKKVAHASLTISGKMLDGAQFPQKVTNADGFVLIRPKRWR